MTFTHGTCKIAIFSIDTLIPYMLRSLAFSAIETIQSDNQLINCTAFVLIVQSNELHKFLAFSFLLLMSFAWHSSGWFQSVMLCGPYSNTIALLNIPIWNLEKMKIITPRNDYVIQKYINAELNLELHFIPQKCIKCNYNPWTWNI